ncbi:MAG: hypothetical protein ACTHJ0_00825 [Flavipsychrobacter sp.]
MEDQKKHIDDLFRQQLNDYQEAPRAGMWNRIEDGLDKIDATKKPGNKNTGGSRGLLGYSIALLLIAGAAFFIFKQSHKQSLQSANGNKTVAVNSVVATAKERKVNDVSPGELNEDKAMASATKNAAANNALTTGTPTPVNTSGNANSENIKRTNIQGHTANRVARRKLYYAAHPNKLLNNSNTVTADKQDSKGKANTVANTKADDNIPALQPSAESHVTKVAKKKSKAINETTQAHQQKDRDDAAAEVSSKQITRNQESQLSNPGKVETGKTKKRAALTKINSGDLAAVMPSASSPASKKIADKADVDITKGKQPEKQVKQEPAISDINAEKKNKTERNDKKIAAAEKKIQLPINNSSTITPESKPVAAKKSEAKEMQKTDDSKQEESAKSNTDTNITGNTKNNTTAESSGGSDDIAHQVPMAFNLQAGVKLGYEQGFGQYTTSKFLGAVYAQVGLSDKLAIMLQPAVKYTKLNKTIDNGSEAYYRNTGKYYDSTKSTMNPILASYYYYGTYDSIIVKRSTTSTSYIGFEIPVLLKYRLSKSLSLLGGVNIDVSNLFAIGDNINTIHRTTSIDSTGVTYIDTFSKFFNTLTYKHSGTPYSSYVPTLSSTQATVRLGYMLGVDYSLADKFTLEFLVTQSLSGYNNISDKNIKNIYSQPYFRLSVGYRFLNITRKKTPYNGGL